MIKLDPKKLKKTKSESNNFDGNFKNPKHSFYFANGIIFYVSFNVYVLLTLFLVKTLQADDFIDFLGSLVVKG